MAYNSWIVAKKNERDPLVGKSVRLHRSQLEFVKLLTEHQVFPGNESDVLRHLLQRAIEDVKRRGEVKSHVETMALLREQPQES